MILWWYQIQPSLWMIGHVQTGIDFPIKIIFCFQIFFNHCTITTFADIFFTSLFLWLYYANQFVSQKCTQFLFSADWLLPRSAMLSNDVIEQCFKPFQWNQICILFHGLNFHGFYLKMLVYMRNYSLESRNLVNWMKTISRY